MKKMKIDTTEWEKLKKKKEPIALLPDEGILGGSYKDINPIRKIENLKKMEPSGQKPTDTVQTEDRC
jgi:hypothetical protein